MGNGKGRPGSVVLITGCSSGFGLAASIRLAERGHQVYATMRDLGKDAGLLEAARTASVDLHVHELDVTKLETIRRVCSHIDERFGRLDALVNNAGYGLGGYFADIDEAEYRDQFETNFFGVLGVTRLALPLLLRSKRGKIINISSVSGLSAIPGAGAYQSSKWAIEGYSEGLRMELLPLGIQVCLVEPGAYPTKAFAENLRFAARAFESDSPFASYAARVHELFRGRNRVLRGDVGEIAGLIARIIEQRRPRFRHIIGEGAKLQYYLRRALPYAWYEGIVMSYLFGRVKNEHE